MEQQLRSTFALLRIKGSMSLHESAVSSKETMSFAQMFASSLTGISLISSLISNIFILLYRFVGVSKTFLPTSELRSSPQVCVRYSFIFSSLFIFNCFILLKPSVFKCKKKITRCAYLKKIFAISFKNFNKMFI